MAREPQSIGRKPSQADVSRLPFTTGVVLAISGLNTFLQGLYTISSWQGWLFVVTGLVVGGAAASLIFDIPGATIVALVAACASLVISAIWVAMYQWFNLAAMALHLVAIYAIVGGCCVDGPEKIRWARNSSRLETWQIWARAVSRSISTSTTS